MNSSSTTPAGTASSAAFRLILAIPHLLLVGSIVAFSFGASGAGDFDWRFGWTSEVLLGLAAGVVSIVAWFALLFTRRHPRGMWDFVRWFMTWRVNALAYMMLLRDEYPPFGSGDYPGVRYEVEYRERPANLWNVGLRIFYAIPHIIIVGALGVAWAVTAVIAWFAILFTGAYPEGLANFALGVFRWQTRVESYVVYLLRDEYPPFSLD